MKLPHFSTFGSELANLLGGTSSDLFFDPTRAIYTNRDLNLAQIAWVGFDMDYTLAVYRKLAMEELQFDLTVDYLIRHNNYPKAIKSLKYDPHLIIRGLVLDKTSGRLLKMDAHNRPVRGLKRPKAAF